MNCVFWPLVNKFTILTVEEYKESCSDLSNILFYLLHNNWNLSIHHSKKRLSLCLTINVFNVCGTLLYLSVSLETTNTSESFFIYTLVDFRTIRVFINWSFVEKYYLNTYRFLKFVPMYNIDSTLNKAGQILEVNIMFFLQNLLRVDLVCSI